MRKVAATFLTALLALSSFGFDIAVDGKGACACVTEGSARAKALASEFAKYVERMSGAKIPVVETAADAEALSPRPSGIVRFATPYAASAVDELAVLVSPDGRTLEVTGDAARGPAYALYALLEHFGCRWWSAWYETVPAVKTLRLADGFRLVEKPAFECRYGQGECEVSDPKWGLKVRESSRLDKAMASDHPFGAGETLCLRYLKPKEHFQNHPDWYAWVPSKARANGLPTPSPLAQATNDAPCRAKDGGIATAAAELMEGGSDEDVDLEEGPCSCRRCVAKRGVAARSPTQPCTRNPEALAELLREVEAELTAHPETEWISIAFNDNDGMCRCADCEAFARQHGGNAALGLVAANHVANGIAKKWPKVRVSTLAYWTTLGAPSGMTVAPNVWVCLAISRNMSLPQRINNLSNRRMNGWRALVGDRLTVWDYYANFRLFTFPTPDFDLIPDNLRFFREAYGVKIMTAQLTLGKFAHLTDLRSYVFAKAAWNPDLDGKKLVDEWVANVCGPAADLVRGYLADLVRIRSSKGISSGMYGGNFYEFMTGEDFIRFRQTWEKAMDLVKDDPARFAMVERMAFAPLADILVNYGKPDKDIPGAAKRLGYALPTRRELVDTMKALYKKYRTGYWSEQKDFDSVCDKFLSETERKTVEEERKSVGELIDDATDPTDGMLGD